MCVRVRMLAYLGVFVLRRVCTHACMYLYESVGCRSWQKVPVLRMATRQESKLPLTLPATPPQVQAALLATSFGFDK